MRDFMDIGSSPCDEPCAQVGEPDYSAKARAECGRFIELIRKKLGIEPLGAYLAIKSFPHNFGIYHEVVVHFDDDDEEARNYAYLCEAEAPRTWQDGQPLSTADVEFTVKPCSPMFHKTTLAALLEVGGEIGLGANRPRGRSKFKVLGIEKA